MSARPGPPGTQKPRRFVPRFHYELLVCGMRGYRCLRCDSWLPLPGPSAPARRFPPDRDEVELPLRGKALRDKVVLRVIAVDRAIHFVLLAALSALLFVVASHVAGLRRLFNRVVTDYGGPGHVPKHGLAHDVERLVTLQAGTIRLVALVAAAYAVLEGLEAVGLWLMRRWAEYLTFVATTALLPLEVYELTKRVSPFKIAALVVNLAIVLYLLWAKRLFGLRGGAAAEEAARARDVGWEALERTAPTPIVS